MPLPQRATIFLYETLEVRLSTKVRLFLLFTVLFTIFDQITKIAVVKHITYRTEEIPVFSSGFLSLSWVHAQNRGAAFGAFQGQTLMFVVFTIVVIPLLLYMLRDLPADDKLQSSAIGLIMSGAVGNFIDRIHKQSVTDFIRVYTEHPGARQWLNNHDMPAEWPTFNIADAAIVIGLGLFLIHYLFFEKDNPAAAAEPPPEPLDAATPKA